MIYARDQTAFPDIGDMTFPTVETKVRDYQLTFEVRHWKQPDDKGVDVFQLGTVDPRQDRGVWIERKVCRVAQRPPQHRRDPTSSTVASASSGPTSVFP